MSDMVVACIEQSGIEDELKVDSKDSCHDKIVSSVEPLTDEMLFEELKCFSVI